MKDEKQFLLYGSSEIAKARTKSQIAHKSRKEHKTITDKTILRNINIAFKPFIEFFLQYIRILIELN